MTHLTAEFVEEMKQLLLAKQKTLQDDIAGIHAHTEEGDDVDSSAQEVAEDEVNRDVLATMREDLEKIKSALQKIEAGTYGIDSEGKEISVERLKVLPWADKAL